MEPVRPGELKGFFRQALDALDRLNIAYMVVGGYAAIFYGEPRLTVDVDIVADLREQLVPGLLAAFPAPDYYLSEEAMREAIRAGRMFNIIHAHTGAKVDVVPLGRSAFARGEFSRRQRLPYDESGAAVWIISPEDLIVAKLRAYRETSSDKHLRDARGALLMQWDMLDMAALRERARAAGLEALLDDLLAALRREMAGEM